MRKLHFQHGKVIHKTFSPKGLNVLFLFQVNCPGCFLYALPLFNRLYKKYATDVGFVAMSTAFEDFELNTENNTHLLQTEGKLVGETEKALAKQGIPTWPYPLNFPIVMDKTVNIDEYTSLVEDICALNPNFSIWSEFDQRLLRSKVLKYLQAQHKVSYTFMANQFSGTPTMALFNQNMDLLHSWFGHVPEQEIVDSLNKLQ